MGGGLVSWTSGFRSSFADSDWISQYDVRSLLCHEESEDFWRLAIHIVKSSVDFFDEPRSVLANVKTSFTQVNQISDAYGESIIGDVSRLESRSSLRKCPNLVETIWTPNFGGFLSNLRLNRLVGHTTS